LSPLPRAADLKAPVVPQISVGHNSPEITSVRRVRLRSSGAGSVKHTYRTSEDGAHESSGEAT
jgi:hypothetical protein